MDIDALIKRVSGCAFIVHKELGSGFLGKVYENSMRIALEEENLAVMQQCSVPVMFHGKIVGDFMADLLVEDQLIVELKAVQNLGKEHEVQLVNYLTATGIDDGLLINFGSSVKIKRKFRLYRTHQDQEPSNRSKMIYPTSKPDLNRNL